MSCSHPKDVTLYVFNHHYKDPVVHKFKSFREFMGALDRSGISLTTFANDMTPHGGRYMPFRWSGYYDHEGTFILDRKTGIPESYFYLLVNGFGEYIGRQEFWSEVAKVLPRKPYKPRRYRPSRWHDWRNLKGYGRRMRQGEAVVDDLEPPVRNKVKCRLDDPWENPPDRSTPKSWKHQSKKRSQWER